MTHVVDKLYPNLITFYEDLNIDRACEGMDTILYYRIIMLLFG